MSTQRFAHTGPTPAPDDKNGPYATFIQLFEDDEKTVFTVVVRDGSGTSSKIEMSANELLRLAAAICLASR